MTVVAGDVIVVLVGELMAAVLMDAKEPTPAGEICAVGVMKYSV